MSKHPSMRAVSIFSRLVDLALPSASLCDPQAAIGAIAANARFVRIVLKKSDEQFHAGKARNSFHEGSLIGTVFAILSAFETMFYENSYQVLEPDFFNTISPQQSFIECAANGSIPAIL